MIGAVDIGGTKIAVGLVDRNGSIVEKTFFRTEATFGPDHSMKRITSWFFEKMKSGRYELEGVGIGCTGPVFPFSGEIGDLEFLPGWNGFNIVKCLQIALGVDVALENDADAAALGEWAWGCGRNSQYFVLVTVGTGIGVGIIINGQVYRGVNNSHPEIGHHFIDPSGPVCSCGGKGCWESLASGPAMEVWAENHHPYRQHITAKELCQQAEEGDPFSLTVVNRTAEYLAIGIANIVNSFCPDTIAITGGLVSRGQLFYPVIKTTIKKYCRYVPVDKVQITMVHPEKFIGLLGAAQVFIKSKLIEENT